MSKPLNLFRDEIHGTFIRIDVEVNDKGDVVLSGQDVGDAPERHFGKDDYEYFVTVRARDKDTLVLELMKHVFGDDPMASSKFKDWLTERGIASEFYCF